MILSILRLLAAIVLAFLAGKVISKWKLPSILGWLIAGMILGPHALSLINQEVLEAVWYQSIVHILECAVGLMIGTELVWRKLRQSGRSIIITTLTQSLGTFLLVALVFGVVFYFSDVPLYLAFLFGGIALATAPAPALSIVREFKTKGPVTSTLIPMAALDDIVGCIVFFSTVAIVCRGFARLYDCPGRAAAPGNRRDYRTAGRLRIKEGAPYFGNPGAADPHHPDCLRRGIFVQQPTASPGAQLYAYRDGLFRHFLQYGIGATAGANHERIQSDSWRGDDYRYSESWRAA